MPTATSQLVPEPTKRNALARCWPELLCAILFGAWWFAAPAYRTLTEPDEGRYAEIPREMLTSGDWIVPHLNGIQYLEKPPLQFWATAAAYKALGITNFNSRLWSVGLGFLGLWIIYAIGRVQFGLAAGRYAALIAASSPLYVFIAQVNVLDMGLAFFLTCALGSFLQAQRQRQQPHWMWLCWCALALGFLQKGLVALALPALALLIFSLVQRDLALWRRLHLLAGLLIFSVVTLPWLLLMTQHSPEFLEFFFVHEHLMRFATTVHDRVQPWWFFIAISLVGTLPWWTAIGVGVREACKQSTNATTFATERFMLIWAITIVAFFSMSASKLAPYIVPVVAPLALLAGAELARRAIHVGGWRHLLPAWLIAASAAATPWWLPALQSTRIRHESYTVFSHWLAAAGVLIALAAATAFALARSRAVEKQMVAVAALSFGLCSGLTVISCGTNSLEMVRGGPSIGAAFAPFMRDDTPLYCVGTYPQTLIFALRRTCVLVQYYGELNPKLAGGAAHWLPSLEQFTARWSQQPNAVAMLNPIYFERLRALGVPLQAIARDEVIVLAIHPRVRN